MTTQPNAENHFLRFRTGNGKWLTDEIVYIEALASERLSAGIAYDSVQTGSLALLKLALNGVSTGLDGLSAEMLDHREVGTVVARI